MNSVQKLNRNNGNFRVRVKQDEVGWRIMSAELVYVHAEQTDTDFLIYTGNFCGYCTALKRLLNGNKLSYTEYNFDEHAGLRKQVVAATGHRTVPVVFDLREDVPRFIGGFDETNRYLR